VSYESRISRMREQGVLTTEQAERLSRSLGEVRTDSEHYSQRSSSFWIAAGIMLALLLVVDPENDLVRMEIGRSLEGVYTDAFVAYIEQRQMVPFFQANRVADGIFATTELLAGRANEAIQGEEFDPVTVAGFEKSSGAGAKSRAGIATGYQRPEGSGQTEDHYWLCRPTIA